MQLDEEQRRAFYRDGFLHLPGVVPRAQMERALAAIDASLECGLAPARMDEFSARSFCPELRSSPETPRRFTCSAPDAGQSGRSSARPLSTRPHGCAEPLGGCALAVFFRLYRRDHDADALDILADIWREYPDLRRFA